MSMRVELPGENPRVANTDFSPTFHRWVARARHLNLAPVQANWSQIVEALAVARNALPLAADDAVARIYQRNPMIFYYLPVSSQIAECPMLTYLPLNSEGVAAMIDGRFNGLEPNPEHIARIGELPEGIYLWLLYSPGQYCAGISLIEDVMSPIVRMGVPFFSRPMHDTSRKLLEGMGCQKANTLFPAAPDWLYVSLPLCEMPGTRAKITIRPVGSMHDLATIYALRALTYIGEQQATFEEEFDANDFCATHLMAEVNGDPAGCVRIRYFGEFAKLERLVVTRKYRQSRVMFKLVRAAFEHCRKKGFRKLYAHAREDLVPAWERFGARLIEGRAEFGFADVRYRELELDIDLGDEYIGWGSDPILLNRPEGEWHRSGPLDRGQLRKFADRSSQIEANTRRFGQ